MLTISFPKDYHGDCICGNGEAKHKVWCEFDDPLPPMEIDGETIVCKGIWHWVCDECYAKEQ